MMKHIFQNEKLLLASLGANGLLEGLHHAIEKLQPEMTALLTGLQIAVAAATLAHIVRKFLKK